MIQEMTNRFVLVAQICTMFTLQWPVLHQNKAMVKGVTKKSTNKLSPQFLINISGYKNARRLGHNSFEW